MKPKIVIATVVLIGLVLVLISLNDTDEIPQITNFAIPALQNDLSRIDLTKGDKSLVLEKVGNTWKATKPVDYPANLDHLQKVEDAFKEKIRADRSLKINDQLLKDKKLIPEEALMVTLYEGQHIVAEFQIGETEMVEETLVSRTWVRPKNSDTIFRLMVDLGFLFDKPLGEWREQKLTHFNKEDVIQIEISHKGSSIKMEVVPEPKPNIETTSDKQPEPYWQLIYPKGIQLSHIQVNSLIHTLSNLHTYDFADTISSTEAGLDRPSYSANFILKDGSFISYSIGREFTEGDQKYNYLGMGGKENIYILRNYQANNLRKTLAKLRDRDLLKLDRASINDLLLKTPEGNLHFIKKKNTWKMREPIRLSEVNTELLGPCLSVFTHLRADHFPEDIDATTAGLTDNPLEAIVTLDDETTHTLLIGKKIQEGQELYYAALDDDHHLFALMGNHVQNLSRPAKDFKLKK